MADKITRYLRQERWSQEESTYQPESYKFIKKEGGYLENVIHIKMLGLKPTPDISHIRDAIQQSRRMLEFGDDWDDEGSVGYTEAVWERSSAFLLNYIVDFLKGRSISIEAPSITPGPDGSFDIYWRLNGRKLLVNIPADENASATFYGDNRDGDVVKGSLNTATGKQWLLTWLTE